MSRKKRKDDDATIQFDGIDTLLCSNEAVKLLCNYRVCKHTTIARHELLPVDLSLLPERQGKLWGLLDNFWNASVEPRAAAATMAERGYTVYSLFLRPSAAGVAYYLYRLGDEELQLQDRQIVHSSSSAQPSSSSANAPKQNSTILQW
jgi:hypothetical protein